MKNNVFSCEVIKARRSKELAQREVAEKLGLDIVYYSQLENDWHIPSKEVLANLCSLLGLDIVQVETIQELYCSVIFYLNNQNQKYFFKIKSFKGSSQYFDSMEEAESHAEGSAEGINFHLK